MSLSRSVNDENRAGGWAARTWTRLFLAERPSIGLAFFRIAAALTTGFYVLPTLLPLKENYFSGAFKVVNTSFFPLWFIDLVQRSPDGLVGLAAGVFVFSWFGFLIGWRTQLSGVVMLAACYYFYALNDFVLGTLSWDILLVTLVLMMATPYPGDYFSLDALRGGGRQAFRRMRPFFIQRLLQMQIAAMYFYTALYKISPEGNWLTGNPILYLMRLPPEGVVKFFMFKDVLAARPGLCYGIGLMVVAVELAMPFLLFCRRTRRSAIYLGFLFHITLILTLDVPAIFFFLFPAQLLLFIPPEDILAWIDRRRALYAAAGPAVLIYDGHCGFCRRSVTALEGMDLFGRIRPVDYHTAPAGTLPRGLTPALAHSQLHLLEFQDRLSGGFFAFRRLCHILPMLFPWLVVVYFPGAGIIGPLVYRWVATNRYLFHRNEICQNNTCFREE